jgi:UDP-N-acetylglucosamine 1-carboxyvinyltransferase
MAVAFQIDGGATLRGMLAAGGSKNAALPIMAAAILADGAVEIENAPRLADVDTLAAVLGQLGVQVGRTETGLRLETVDSRPTRAGYELVRRMRASFCVLGPLLARRGTAVVSLPGGCRIGDRPVDLHLRGLTALGAELKLSHGYVIARAPRLVGAQIDLSGQRGPTVTGTANVLSAAVLAQGTTTITGAAVEPEIVDLGRFLNAMGARISGLGSSTLRVEGVRRLTGVRYRVIPDRIEIATLLLAAAITRGEVTVTGVVPEHLESVVGLLRQAGAEVETGEQHVAIDASGPLRPVDITARPYPGIPTDVQAQWMALLAGLPGSGVVRDEVFPDRFSHVDELRRLGAQIERRSGMAVVTGVTQLTGAAVTASDLRASAALVLAGLAARGRTTVEEIQHLDRGYERLDQKLNSLGARVERIGSIHAGQSARVDRPSG